ncbi:MAG: Uma2 family endonuclease [Pseudonocardia sp.]|nr:Uma2 family endonuclease [Pseudonocardia sp.]
MADEPAPLAHEGAWTEDAYLALDTAGRHVELIDGSLLVGPTPDDRHANAVAVVRAAVAAALPDGLEVTGPVALRLSPGRILVPDLVVAVSSAAVAGEVRDSSVALVVIDVVGAGNGVADRWFKPQLYAGSRIPYALLVDHDDPFAVGSMLIGGRYHEYASAEGDGVLLLEEPFALELALAALAAPVTPGDPGPGDPAAEPDAAEPDVAGSAGAPSARGRAEGEPAVAAPDAGESAAGPPCAEEPGAGARPDRGLDAGAARSGAGENGARANGAGTGAPHDGSTDPGPRRSHPDEDHSVHA